MVIKNLAMLSLWAILAVGVEGCSQPKKEPDLRKLCEEFCKLNRGKIFDGLFDVSIGTERMLSVYDESANQYGITFNTISVFDTVKKDWIYLWVFKRNASLIDRNSMFKRIAPNVREFLSRKFKVQEAELLNSYVKYVNGIYLKYYAIRTPGWSSYKNVILEGNPTRGKFITFTLNDRATVYFLASRLSLSQYWSKHFEGINKIDEEWYYEISPAKKF